MIGKLICKWLGHRWGDWKPTGDDGLAALINYRKCERCGLQQSEGVGGIDRTENVFWRNKALADHFAQTSVIANAHVIADLQHQWRNIAKYQYSKDGDIIELLQGVNPGDAVTMQMSGQVSGRPKPGGAFEYDYDGITFTIYGTHYDAIPEGELSPPEPAAFEVEQIWLGDFEMSQWLSENAPKVIPEIERRLA